MKSPARVSGREIFERFDFCSHQERILRQFPVRIPFLSHLHDVKHLHTKERVISHIPPPILVWFRHFLSL
jgi:hypothetical protein